ncbi:hypothetical protein K438DRAFT_1583404, partial [Mycena galopus ATCC 62051]
YDETLIREQLARNYAVFGDDAMQKIWRARVVVGCGGVGSWAAVMLVRSGISHIRLVDFDYVTLSLLNRHATAALADVGTPKVQCVARALRQIAKFVDVEACIDVWKHDGKGAKLLEGADWAVDAIDNIGTKVDLLRYCVEHDIKVFSSMGADTKSDPTRVQIADIANTVYDPLARAVRTCLRKLGIASGVPVVYSTEVPAVRVGLLPLPEEEFAKGKEQVRELGVLDEFRVRILPVLGPLPALFGLHTATYVLCALAGKPIANPLPVKNRRKVYERMLKDLMARGGARRLPLDEDDVALLFEDVHRGRTAVPPHAVPVKPTLVVWDRSKPVGVENVVVMERGEAERHEPGLGGGGPGAWGEDVREAVRKRIREVERFKEWVM